MIEESGDDEVVVEYQDYADEEPESPRRRRRRGPDEAALADRLEGAEDESAIDYMYAWGTEPESAPAESSVVDHFDISLAGAHSVSPTYSHHLHTYCEPSVFRMSTKISSCISHEAES